MSAAYSSKRAVAGLRWELLERPEDDVFFVRGLDLGQIDVAVVGDFVTLPGLHAQHASEMTSLVAVDLGLAAADLFVQKIFCAF